MRTAAHGDRRWPPGPVLGNVRPPLARVMREFAGPLFPGVGVLTSGGAQLKNGESDGPCHTGSMGGSNIRKDSDLMWGA